MKRRHFLASLFAIPAGVKAALSARKATILGFTESDSLERHGISLTRATIQPLTPAEVEMMGRAELKLLS